MKKLLSILLIVTMLLSTVVVVMPITAASEGAQAQAEETPAEETLTLPKPVTTVTEGTAISDEAGWLAITTNGTYHLTSDIVVDEAHGTSAGTSTAWVSGITIYGNGHKITYTGDRAMLGWGAGNIKVQDLIIDGTMTLNGSTDKDNYGNVGVLCNGWDGNVTISNVLCDVDIVVNSGYYTANTGNKFIGGIMSKFQGTALDLDDVVNSGSIILKSGTSASQVGGIIGDINITNNPVVTFDNVRNDADITIGAKVSKVGGLIGSASVASLTLTNCVNNGDITASADVERLGGIIGHANGPTSTAGTININSCTNNGKLDCNFSDASNNSIGHSSEHCWGGIIGRIYDITATVDGCVNNADIEWDDSRNNGNEGVGGIIGWAQGGNNDKKLTVSNCVNFGGFTIPENEASALHVGGIMGKTYRIRTAEIYNCVNDGDLTAKTNRGWSDVGGIVGGYMSLFESVWVTGSFTMTDCHNLGNLTGLSTGGIVGASHQMTKEAISLNISYCSNSGNITAVGDAGGILGGWAVNGGNPNGVVTLNYCYNEGAINGAGSTGGIVGENASVTAGSISNSANAGTLTAAEGVAKNDIIAVQAATTTLNNTLAAADVAKAVYEHKGSTKSPFVFSAEHFRRNIPLTGYDLYIFRDFKIADGFHSGAFNKDQSVTRTIYGNSHTIDIANCMLFQTVENTVIKDLTVTGYQLERNSWSGEFSPLVWYGSNGSFVLENVHSSVNMSVTSGTVKSIGGLVSKAEGSLTMKNCSYSGTITIPGTAGNGENNCIGGLAGLSKGALVLEGCSSSGTIDLTPCFYTGGLVGKANSTATISGSSYSGTIKNRNGINVTGGFISQVSKEVKLSDSIYSGSIITQAITNADSVVGGFIGGTYSTATLTDIASSGTITVEGAMQGRVAGVIGYATGGLLTITNDTDKNLTVGGTINIKAGTAGNNDSNKIAGVVGLCAAANITGVNWTGTIESNAAIKCSVGGFIGKNTGTVNFSNCIGDGTMTFNTASELWNSYTGGFIGEKGAGSTVNSYNCTNKTDITNAKSLFIAGFVGVAFSGNLNFDGCVNEGNMTIENLNDANGCAAGYVAYCNTNISIQNSVNKGNISVTKSGDGNVGSGGFIGHQLTTDANTVIDNCINLGNVSSCDLAGGIIGKISKPQTTLTITDTVNAGDITSTKSGDRIGVGGIIGGYLAASATNAARIERCVNAGSVITTKNVSRVPDSYGKVGGIIGDAGAKIVINDCINMGKVASNNGASFNGAFPMTNGLETLDDPQSFGDKTFMAAFISGTGNIYLDGTVGAPQAGSTHSGGASRPGASFTAEEHYRLSSVATLAQVADKLEALETVGFSTKNLDAAIKDYNDNYAANENTYTVKSWTPYKNAVESAQNVLANYNATEDLWARFQYPLVDAEVAIASAKTALQTKADYYKNLQAAIDAANGKVEADYTGATWTAMQTAKANAMAAITNGNENDAEIGSLTTALNNAINGLVGTAALKTAISAAEAKGDNADGKYSTASWNAMTDALAAANNAKANATTTDAVTEATDTLNAKVAALIDVSALSAKLAEVRANDDYKDNVNGEGFAQWTEASYKVLTDALTSGDSVVANALTAQAVTDAIAAIDQAITFLVEADVLVRLKARMSQAEALDPDDYTVASWEVLTDALADANDAAINYSTDKVILESADVALEAAIEALINIKTLKISIATTPAEAEEYYTVDTYSAYAEALEAAQAALTATTQDDVDAAKAALDEAFKALELAPITEEQEEEVAGAIETGDAYDNNHYTEETWNEYEAALEAVKALESLGSAATKVDIANAMAALKEAEEKLVKAEADEDDYAAINAVIDEANALDGAIYADSTYAYVMAKVAEANALLENDTNNRDTVQYAREAIEAAMLLLVEKPTGLTEEQKLADRVAGLSEKDRLAYEMMVGRLPASDISTMNKILDALLGVTAE